MTEWIAVEDKKPPSGELVLACDMQTSALSQTFRVTWMAGDEWFSGYVCGAIDAPTHWTPLPPDPASSGRES